MSAINTNADSNQKGIDIKNALSILSERSSQPGDKESKTEDGCNCHGTLAPENARNMGQTIDLFAHQATQFDPEAAKQRQEQERIQQERTERHAKIQQQLNSLSESELLKAVLKAQEDRVKTYREYERSVFAA